MKRTEIDNKYKWNLEALLNGKELEEHYKNIADLTKEINDYRETYFKSVSNFKLFLSLSEKRSTIIGKLNCYLYNKCSENVSNSDNLNKLLYFENWISTDSEVLYWVDNSILDNEKNIRLLLVKDDNLKHYVNAFERSFRQKEHKLSTENEKLLAKISNIFGSHSDIFNVLSSSDFTFDPVNDKNKKQHPLTQNNFRDLITSEDRKIRENAYLNYWKEYKTYGNTLALNYYYAVLESSRFSKVYNFKSTLDAALFDDNVTRKFFDSLHTECQKNANLIIKWKQIVFKILKTDNPKPWDYTKPFFKLSNKKYSIEEAKPIIYNALKIFGDDYKKKIDFIFNNKCIDYMANDNKRQGAYSFGVWQNIPYICMNWQNKYEDLSTLIHELGHSVHTLFSNEKQLYPDHSYPIFLAEIASIVNEMMLIKYLLETSENKELKKFILEKAIREFLATVYRQLQFSDFEVWAHNEVDQGKPLSLPAITKQCQFLSTKYYPSTETEKYQSEYAGLWGIYVPHFYRPFYVYKYSIGMIVGIIVFKKLVEDKKYYKKYLQLLSNGCKNWPLDILKTIDIDLENVETYKIAYKEFESWLDKLNALI